MSQEGVSLERILAEIGYGELRVTIVDKKIIQIPPQRVERPGKAGVDHDIVIRETIRLSA